MPKKQNDHEALRRAAKRLFATQDGQTVLAAIKARTVARPSWPASGNTDGHAMALMLAVREGENGLYRYIKTLTQPKPANQNDNLKQGQ